MSAETSAWAKEQQCGDRTLKAVLREIANWARPDGMVEFLSVKRIAEVIEVSPRTVQRAIAQLEPRQTDDDPDEKRLGLIRRVERFRPDGGQGPCGFELVGYQPPLTIDRLKTPRDKMSPPHDTGVTLPGDKMTGDGVTPASPLKRDKNSIPLSTSDEVDAPPADVQPDLLGEGGADGCSPEPPAKPVPDAPPAKPHVLPDDWQAPDIDDLPKEARALVKQWPSGAYAAQCANFKGYWTEIDRQKRTAKGWRATLANWLSRVHAETMRAAKAGVSFDACAVPVASSAPPAAAPPVAAKRREDGQSAALHAEIRAMVGDDAYQRWLEPVAMIFEPPGVVVIVASAFQREWLHEHLHGKLAAAARLVLGARWVRIDVERPDDVRALDQQGERRDG